MHDKTTITPELQQQSDYREKERRRNKANELLGRSLISRLSAWATPNQLSGIIQAIENRESAERELQRIVNETGRLILVGKGIDR